MIYLDLILNLTLLVALSIVSNFIERRWSRQSLAGVLLQGGLFGGAAVLGMLRPFILGPGLIFDGRSIMVSLGALFFGPWTAAVAAAMTVTCRLALGGVGTLTGSLVILSSAVIGLLGHFYIKPSIRPPSAQSLYVFGLIVHLAMIALMFTLPGGMGLEVVKRIGFPVLLLYPLATILAGKILSDQVQALQLTEALRASEEKYRLMVETAMEGIWVMDRDHLTVYVNQAMADMLGYAPSEVLGKRVEDFSFPEDLPEHEERMKKRHAGEDQVYECRLKRKNGSQVWVRVSARSLKDAEGVFAGSYAMLTNLTETKKAEEEQRKLQEQLNQVQKMESIGRLAGGVAHDFNNILAIIMGHTEMAMLRLNQSDPIFSDLEEIQKAAERSAKLTRQLLAFARKQIVAPKVLDLNETVESMLNMLRRLIGEDIDLDWLPGENLWAVKTDPSQIDQILANLAVNARDAIKGVGKITIETRNVRFDGAVCPQHLDIIPGDYVQLSVSDNGSGMDKDTLSKLFEPFFTTKGVGQGTGLGLATVYGIVKQNNGFIDVYSEVGHGATFRIYLPRYTADIEHHEIDELQRPAGRGKETILLVEDEPVILEMVTRMLESHGYNVLAAGSPKEALYIAGTHESEIHLLITDVIMPSMNGRDLAANLAQLYPKLKCLFMSGYTSDIIANHGGLDDESNFLQKPFSMGDLMCKVREVLGPKETAEPSDQEKMNGGEI